MQSCSVKETLMLVPFSNGCTSPMTSKNESYHNDNFSNKTEIVQENTLKIVSAG